MDTEDSSQKLSFLYKNDSFFGSEHFEPIILIYSIVVTDIGLGIFQ